MGLFDNFYKKKKKGLFSSFPFKKKEEPKNMGLYGLGFLAGMGLIALMGGKKEKKREEIYSELVKYNNSTPNNNIPPMIAIGNYSDGDIIIEFLTLYLNKNSGGGIIFLLTIIIFSIYSFYQGFSFTALFVSLIIYIIIISIFNENSTEKKKREIGYNYLSFHDQELINSSKITSNQFEEKYVNDRFINIFANLIKGISSFNKSILKTSHAFQIMEVNSSKISADKINEVKNKSLSILNDNRIKLLKRMSNISIMLNSIKDGISPDELSTLFGDYINLEDYDIDITDNILKGIIDDSDTFDNYKKI